MATTTTTSQQSTRPASSSRLVRVIAIVLLALIVLVGLAVLIIWLAVKPKKLIYSIEDAAIHGFNLTNNHLTARYNFVVRAYNPNTRVSVYYDKVETSVSYDNQKMAYGTVDPFFQPRRNVTRLELKLVSQDLALFGDAGRDLRLEKSSGDAELEVRLKARIRFKVGAWKSRHYTMRVLCEPVLAHFSSSKGIQKTYCDVDL